jgi:hypothetical protein
MKPKRYRIVTDKFNGYEVQYKVWWWPWWIQAPQHGHINTFSELEKAEEWVKHGCPKKKEPVQSVVKYL